jgi:hypothetical protein
MPKPEEPEPVSESGCAGERSGASAETTTAGTRYGSPSDTRVGLCLIEDFVDGKDVDGYEHYAAQSMRSMESYDNVTTRRYWICAGVINLVNRWRWATYTCSTEDDLRWALAAHLTGLGVRIVQRTIAGSPGESEACNGILGQCADPLVRAFSDEPDTLNMISELIADYRYADAVADRTVDPDLRQAFQATWEIDEFRAAYALLEP